MPLADFDDALDALDDFLMSDQTPDECMMLTDLDGFLTGLVIGPELILPSEWLPHVWGGGEEPVFEDKAQAEWVLGVIMARYNEIIGQVAEGVLDPIFMQNSDGQAVSSDWAEGFMQAASLRAEAWERLFKSETHGHYLVPFLAVCCDRSGRALIELPEEVEYRFFEEGGELLPAAALEIAKFWRAERSAPQRRPAAPRPGRNDPCPCGSGRKFKKCCGLEH